MQKNKTIPFPISISTRIPFSILEGELGISRMIWVVLFQFPYLDRFSVTPKKLLLSLWWAYLIEVWLYVWKTDQDKAFTVALPCAPQAEARVFLSKRQTSIGLGSGERHAP